MKETFGKRFQRLRKEKGLTQEEIASRVNITAQSVSKWENDLSAPDISILLELAAILGVTTDYLLGNDSIAETTTFSPEATKDVNKLTLRLIVHSDEADVKLNLPLALIKALVVDGHLKLDVGNGALNNIDFNQILELASQGVLGKLMEVSTSDGTEVSIFVE